jgi:DNA-binding PadR family transcriptional regulator
MADPALLVLSSLADGEKHGYAIMIDIEAFAGVRLGPGTLYGVITRLEERGLIRPVRGDDRRQPYRITPAGKQHLEDRLTGLDRIARTGLRRLREA